MKTIEWKAFMNNTWREQEEPKQRSFSFLPIPTASMFLNEPCLLLLGLGAVIVAEAIWEKRLVKQGKEEEAELLKLITGIILPAGAIGGAVYVILYAGKLLIF